MTNVFPISLPFIIINFNAHSKLKDDLLCAISISESQSYGNESYNIHRTDWKNDIDDTRKYVKLLKDDLYKELSDAVLTIGFDRFIIHNMWFQQYIKTDTHPMHNHVGCHYTCIYFLELPDGAPITQFVDPLNNNVFEPLVKEGDILLIPAMIKHQAPIVTSDVRKTIISFNTSVVCDNGN